MKSTREAQKGVARKHKETISGGRHEQESAVQERGLCGKIVYDLCIPRSDGRKVSIKLNKSETNKLEIGKLRKR